MSGSRPRSGGPGVGLVALSLAAFVALTTELAPIGLLPGIGADLHRSAAAAGVLISAYALMVVLFSVPLTLLTRRVPGRRMLLVALAGYAVCDLLSAAAPTFGALLLARCIGGVAHAVFFSACIGQAARLAAPGRTARAFAVVSAGISAGSVLGSPITTALGIAVGWRLPFAALTGATLVTAVLLARLLPRGGDEPTVAPPRRSGLGAAIGVIGANGLAYFGQYTLYTYVTVVLLHARLPAPLVSVALLLFGVAGLVALWRTASPLDRRPGRTSCVILLVVAAGMVAVGAAPAAPVPVLAAGVLWGAAFGPVATLFQSAAIGTGALGPETAGAWINTTSNLGISAGALLGGAVLAAADVRSLAWCAAVPVVLAALVVARTAPRTTSPSA